MKKIHLVLLVMIAGAIAVLLTFLKTASTYDTVDTARAKPGKFVHLMARLDKTQPIDYDAIKNPNYLSFTVVDTVGKSVKVVYHNAKPDNLEISERLVLKGKYKDGYFDCKDIQTKCPSKYKEEMKATDTQLKSSSTTPASTNSVATKY
ncbi:MAG: cytochrome c maturation protein CcmE [Chitinophagaceae bacterium]